MAVSQLDLLSYSLSIPSLKFDQSPSAHDGNLVVNRIPLGGSFSSTSHSIADSQAQRELRLLLGIPPSSACLYSLAVFWRDGTLNVVREAISGTAQQFCAGGLPVPLKLAACLQLVEALLFLKQQGIVLFSLPLQSVCVRLSGSLALGPGALRHAARCGSTTSRAEVSGVLRAIQEDFGSFVGANGSAYGVQSALGMVAPELRALASAAPSFAPTQNSSAGMTTPALWPPADMDNVDISGQFSYLAGCLMRELLAGVPDLPSDFLGLIGACVAPTAAQRVPLEVVAATFHRYGVASVVPPPPAAPSSRLLAACAFPSLRAVKWAGGPLPQHSAHSGAAGYLLLADAAPTVVPVWPHQTVNDVTKMLLLAAGIAVSAPAPAAMRTSTGASGSGSQSRSAGNSPHQRLAAADGSNGEDGSSLALLVLRPSGAFTLLDADARVSEPGTARQLWPSVHDAEPFVLVAVSNYAPYLLPMPSAHSAESLSAAVSSLHARAGAASALDSLDSLFSATGALSLGAATATPGLFGAPPSASASASASTADMPLFSDLTGASDASGFNSLGLVRSGTTSPHFSTATGGFSGSEPSSPPQHARDPRLSTVAPLPTSLLWGSGADGLSSSSMGLLHNNGSSGAGTFTPGRDGYTARSRTPQSPEDSLLLGSPGRGMGRSSGGSTITSSAASVRSGTPGIYGGGGVAAPLPLLGSAAMSAMSVGSITAGGGAGNGSLEAHEHSEYSLRLSTASSSASSPFHVGPYLGSDGHNSSSSASELPGPLGLTGSLPHTATGITRPLPTTPTAAAVPAATSTSKAAATVASAAAASTKAGSSPPLPPSPASAMRQAGGAGAAAAAAAATRVVVRPASVSAAQHTELQQFAGELAAKLRAHSVTVSVAPAPLALDVSRAATASASTSVGAGGKSKAATVNDLRDRLRALQDRSHSRDEAMLRYFASLGFLELALAGVAVSSHGMRDSIAASYALQSVGNLAMEDGNRARLVSLGGVELIVESMHTHAGSSGARVQKDAVVALRHMAYENDDNKQVILDRGGVAAVIAALSGNADNSQVARQCCGALAIFAVHSTLGEAAKAQIVELGGLEVLLKAMTVNKGDTGLVAAALKAIGTLCSFTEARIRAKDCGCTAYVEQLAEHAGSSGELADAVRQTLRRVRG